MSSRITAEEFEIIKKRMKRSLPQGSPRLEIVGAREVKKRKKPSRDEENLQITCVEWFDRQHPVLSRLFFSITNALPVIGFGKEAKGMWFHKMKRLKAMGLRSGILDMMLVEPRGGYHGLWIEFKVGSNPLSEDQKIFSAMVQARGYSVIEVRTFEEFERGMDWYLGRPE